MKKLIFVFVLIMLSLQSCIVYTIQEPGRRSIFVYRDCPSHDLNAFFIKQGTKRSMKTKIHR